MRFVNNEVLQKIAWIGGVKDMTQIAKFISNYYPKKKDNSKFLWTDDSSFNYTFWHSDQPDCQKYSENCCVAAAFHWFTYNCDIKYPFICELVMSS